jgi:hypothetical protein
LQGTVIAETAHFDYETNIFDVETPSVTASFKFSKAMFTVDEENTTDIVMHDGKFEFQRPEDAPGEVRAQHTFQETMLTKMELMPGDFVRLEITDQGLKAENFGKGLVQMEVNGKRVKMSLEKGVHITRQAGQPGIKHIDAGPRPSGANQPKSNRPSRQERLGSPGGSGGQKGSGGPGGQRGSDGSGKSGGSGGPGK